MCGCGYERCRGSFRLSTEIGPRANVGTFDCSVSLNTGSASGGWAAGSVCAEQGLPSAGADFPQYIMFPSGKKKLGGQAGERLFRQQDVPSHIAMPLIATVHP